MSGRASREKGARAERELANLLAEHLPLEIRRNLIQYQTGGMDLSGLPWSIEVKRHETLSIPAWWRQTVTQSIGGDPPVLAYRPSRKPWRFVVPAYLLLPHFFESDDLEHTIETGLNVFIHLTRLRLAAGGNSGGTH